MDQMLNAGDGILQEHGGQGHAGQQPPPETRAHLKDPETSGSSPSFEAWKDGLARAIGMAKAVGLSEETISRVATWLGSLLAERVDPANREQRLLQELWRVGDNQEHQALARMMAKLVQAETQPATRH